MLCVLKGRAEMVVDEVETAVEIIEKTAKVAEKVSSDVADFLPENGKLKQTALLVERVSKEASKEAQLAIDFIHKVHLHHYSNFFFSFLVMNMPKVLLMDNCLGT